MIKFTQKSFLTFILSIVISGCGGGSGNDSGSDDIGESVQTDGQDPEQSVNNTDSSSGAGNDAGSSEQENLSGLVNLLIESNQFGRSSSDITIDTDSDMHLATYNDTLLLSWRAVDSGQSEDVQKYGVVSKFTVTSAGFELQNEYDFDKQCSFVGGISASSDGSPIAVLCQRESSTFHNMEEAHASDTTLRPSGLENFFTQSNFYNILALTGAQGFYIGDIFTATVDGKDLFTLEFESELNNTPDNVIFISSASRAGNGGSLKYGHLNISYKESDVGPELYNISMKTVSNRDSGGRLHTDMKEIGLERVVGSDGQLSYKRRRITDNYGTGLGVTHPDIAEVAYNSRCSR